MPRDRLGVIGRERSCPAETGGEHAFFGVGRWVMARSVMGGILGFLVGMVTALTLVIGVEVFSNLVHPFPPEFDQSHEQVCEHVRRYPVWVLGTVIPLWSFTAWCSSWIARRQGGWSPAVIVVALCLAAVGLNLWMLPYPTWFEVLIPVCVLLAGWWGCGPRRRSEVPDAHGGETC
jgi:hypothetical protein